MFKAIDVWEKVDATTAVRYRCFQRLTDNFYCVQSADYYHIPINEEQARNLDKQFLELFIEESPDKRDNLYPTLEEAIKMHNREFEEEYALSSVD